MIWLSIYTLFLLLLIGAASARAVRSKQLLLLLASYLFYGTWGIGFLAMLLASSLFNFVIGSALRRKPRRSLLWIGIAVNVGLLSFFKYLPRDFSGIVIPAGMSFWTFQALSYLFDLYHEEELDPTVAEFCLYMAFWPTVLMGPICRLSRLLPQFRELKDPTSGDLTNGLRRIGTGLVMKLVFAQVLAKGVSAGFDQPAGGLQWGGLDVWFLAVGFGFQLFFDFAGYSNIVIGAARLFGFQLEQNFDSPYLATTPSVFWTKWHMSLSSWIRDYVFVPMATIRRETWWRYFAVWSSMVLFGLWHGSKLTFVIWGAYQGTLLVIHRIGQRLLLAWQTNMNGPLRDGFSWLATFLAVSLGWVAFRANDLHQTAAMFGAITSPSSYRGFNLPPDFYLKVLALAGAYFVYTGILQNDYFLWQRKRVERYWTDGAVPGGKTVQIVLENRWFWTVPAFLVLALIVVLVVLENGKLTVSPFVYTRF
jgi:alginate O-acetyltransferase complex protein AlgI